MIENKKFFVFGDNRLLSRLIVTLFFCCVLAILLGSLSPVEALGNPSVNDKVQHIFSYSVTAFLGLAAFGHSKGLPLALFALGATIETLQPALGRDMSFWDAMANALGIATGVIFYCLSEYCFNLSKLSFRH